MFRVSTVLPLLFSLALAVHQTAGADDAKTAPAGDSAAATTREQIAALIRDLGSPVFTTRRAAANELRRVGAEAFDDLFAATESADPEVAASSRYLLRQISVRWVQSDDPASVRRILRNFGESPDQVRAADVLELDILPKREGLAALCRIARYDRSPLISRKAALAVIRPTASEGRKAPVDSEVIDRELGPSKRIGALWLRQFQAQLRDPAAVIPNWQRLIDEEAALVAQNSDETSAEVLIGLMWNLADIHRQLNNRPALSQMADRMMRVESDDPEQVAVALLMWLADEKSWDSVDDLLAHHAERFARGKKPLYAAAHARLAQGNEQLAEKLAADAAKVEATDPLGSFEMAKDLEYRGRYEWAVREYRSSIDDERVESPESIVSRVSLAELMHDHDANQEAAEVLAPLVNSIQDPKVVQLYDQVRSVMATRYSLNVPDSRILKARYHFYLAGQHRAAKDWKQERTALEQALRFDREDSDVLIAMYRLPETDDKFKDDVRKKIADLARTYQQKIDAAPNYAPNYNQWAWLISNTEGDFQKAIRYSHRSLELNAAGEAAEASYLDTLGRCYYAAGDYENAVKYQRQAVEKIPYEQVMKRQLALFEKALAEK
jgi:tetratricopeptide (TPR) repeat protein